MSYQEQIARLSPTRVPARRYGKNHSRRTVMNRVIVIEFMSLVGLPRFDGQG